VIPVPALVEILGAVLMPDCGCGCAVETGAVLGLPNRKLINSFSNPPELDPDVPVLDPPLLP
jgi:hypothetical protein